ncbi:DUF7311 family protein [Halorarum salinum]|uniref:DUF7311 domain-containing protein n=1 Tax=Halorarum salinum TaxID=2743089 RepID=A0A7D5QCE9_9EURY|nr:hypothetical protein [Halobaculum salinum]QLG62999.1 hypothetical protein HUG12_15165 [Halobaculum salinum]
MIRYVLAAVLAVALVSTSLPAIEGAGAYRTDSDLSRFGTALEDEAADLRTGSDPVEPGVAGASRRVSVWLPRGSLTAARGRFVELCPAPGVGVTLEYAVGTRPSTSRPVDADLTLPDGGVRFEESGRHVLELAYRTRAVGLAGDGEVFVAVAEGSSAETGPGGPCASPTASGRTTDDGACVTRPSGPRPVPPTAG